MHEDLKWIIGIIGLLAVTWFATGGIYRQSAQDPFIKPFTETENIETYGGSGSQGGGQNQSFIYGATDGRVGTGEQPPKDIGTQIQDARTEAERIGREIKIAELSGEFSSLKGKIGITGISAYSTTDANNEYLTIQASPANREKILLSGLIVRSAVTGQTITLGNGVYLPFTGTVNSLEPIFLEPGETLHVRSGRSPIGVTFRLNRCIGFLQQFQTFNPALPTECPLPRNEVPLQTLATFNDQCLDYIENLPACQVFPNLPTNLSFECQRFLTNEISYNKCVGRHKSDLGFYRPEWRMYLNRDTKLWKSRREIIQLLDQQGKIVQTYTY